MATNVFDVLKERGYIAQCTNEEEVRSLLENEQVTFYIGFDPTADSLHVGHFLGLMVMSHLQRAGHRPVCLVGGGTGTVGDPSGRTDMRKMLTDEDIEHNCNQFKKQMARFIDFSDGKALMVNNGDWLRKLNYIDLLREVGPHFTVNRMLAAECYKNRMEKGLHSDGSALDEIKSTYGFDTAAIVTMKEVTEYLYNTERQGRVWIDDDLKKAIDEYYAQYGAK